MVMRLRTKIWLVLLLIAVGVVAAILFLPWWLSLALLFVLLLPVWIAIALFVMLKSAGKQIGKEINNAIGKKESRRSLKAGQTFQGNGFCFTFPVACQVTQTVIEDFEALVLKPKLHRPARTGRLHAHHFHDSQRGDEIERDRKTGRDILADR